MEQSKVLDRMRRLCSRREYCESDIRKKLASEEGIDAEAVIASLKADRYLSNARYAEAFARDKSSLDGWGAVKIRYALAAKGVSKEDIDAALEAIDRGAAASRLEKLVSARYRSLSEDPQCRLKLLRYALGRGYAYEEVESAVGKVMGGGD